MSFEYHRHIKLAMVSGPSGINPVAVRYVGFGHNLNFESRAPTFEKTGGMIDLRPVRLRCVQSSCFLFALDSPVTCTKQLLISSSGGEHSFISVRSLNFSPKVEGDYMSWMLIIYITEANLDGWNIPGTDIVVLPTCGSDASGENG